MRLRRPEVMGRAVAPLRRMRSVLGGMLPRRRPRATSPAGRWKASDVVVAGLGIALGFGCAVFPWYIFFNQDKFGVRAVRFEGNRDQLRAAGMRIDERLGIEMEPGIVLPGQLDLFATGTVADEEDFEDPPPGVDVEAQPFPGAPVEYRMIHATPGRAMIADDTGMWVVQRGSLLPDNSFVASIEQRGQGWVLVTSDKKVVELSPH